MAVKGIADTIANLPTSGFFEGDTWDVRDLAPEYTGRGGQAVFHAATYENILIGDAIVGDFIIGGTPLTGTWELFPGNTFSYPYRLPVIRAPGFSSKYKNPVIRTQMDAGPDKQRLRYTAVPKLFTGTAIMSDEDLDVFEGWFVNTIGYGVLRFSMPDPRTGSVREFRFTDMYGESESNGLWEISLPLERMS
jgi:hypothetical protein